MPNLFLKKKLAFLIQALPFFVLAASAQAQPSFTKVFSPDSIGPGSASTLTFTISNGSASGVTDLAFTDTLPASVMIADPSSASTFCGGTLSAPDGGTTISLSGGVLGPMSSCTISVNVTSGTPGTHMNVSGDLTSSAGNSGTASDDLTVATNRPGFSKSFSPSSVTLGSRSTLTFLIDNSLNPSTAFLLSFTDDLPVGMVIADPSNVDNDCGGTLTATPGGSTISLMEGTVLAGSVCTIAVDVIGDAVGELDNVSGDLTSFDAGSNFFSSGLATGTLAVTGGAINLRKSFTDDPVPPGGTVTLEFTITNFNRSDPATALTFTDDLDATLSGLVATGLPMSDICGAGSTLTGTSVLTLSGGNLPAEGSCTFSVTLQVPAGATPGVYSNVTSTVTGNVGGSMVSGGPATDSLTVSNAPLLTKTFLSNPAGAGDTVTLEFTITNTSATSSATDIDFTDNISAFLSGTTVTSAPSPGFCGAGSFAVVSVTSGETIFSVQDANLAPSDSCTFQIDLQLPEGAAAGDYVNTTSDVTAMVDGMSAVGDPASDTLSVVAAPSLSKSFTDDPVPPGGTVTLEFTLMHDDLATGNATMITFTDDLDATLSGLVATGLPMNDICGSGSQISGTSTLTFSGGILAPGESCTFSVTLQVPASAAPGDYTNTTSDVMAEQGGVTAFGNGAEDDLQVSGLSLSKSFTDDPVIPGDTVTLEFTIDNTGTEDATGLFFTDNLDDTLSGLQSISGTMNDICGPGSTIFGTSFLIFTGGNVPAGTSCTFSVTLQVPAGADDGVYGNTTSSLSGSYGGSGVTVPPAFDELTVSSSLLALSKTFTDDPVAPGDTVTLEFTLTNLDDVNAATAIAFTDDLNAALSGLEAVGLPMMDVCGAGSDISGTSVLSFTGGNLPAGGSCTFSVTLQVPASASGGTTATNVTSVPTGTINGLPVDGSPATDELSIETLILSKSFDGPSAAGRTAVLSFRIENLGSSVASGLSFTDDLDAALSGLEAVGLPMSDVCGSGSEISGTSFLNLTDASVLPGGSCTINVTVQVPSGAAPGSYTNTTSELFEAGLPAAALATAPLLIEPPPTFSKSFSPASIGLGQTSTLTFLIDNGASSLTAGNLAFTDNLPGGLAVAAPPNVTGDCGGTLTAVPGSGTIDFSGGSVAPMSSCTISVDVVATAVGTFDNVSGDLTSDTGNSGPAAASLTVNPPPLFSKAFSPDTIAAGGVSTLTFTIDNSASTVAATALDFTDDLPAGVVVASPANASTTCTGGTLTAVPGSGTISYSGGTVGAGEVCTVMADVTSSTPGTYDNVSGDLTSSLGNSGSASDTLVVDAVPMFSKAFAPDVIAVGGVSTLTFTIDNGANALPATGLTFTDDLPAGVVVASPPNVTGDCGGAVTAVAGSGTISFSGGTVGAGSSCTVAVDVTSSMPDTYDNVSSDLVSSLGTSGPATDTLTVVPPPTFSKSFAPTSILRGETTTVIFTLDNSASTLDATGVGFTDNLPAGMEVADPANAMTSCTGGTLTAAPGSTTISYSGGTVTAGTVCTVEVDVTVTSEGSFLNTTEDLTSSLGNSGPASATLTVRLNIIEIPTLGEWGLLALCFLLAGMGVRRLRRVGAR